MRAVRPTTAAIAALLVALVIGGMTRLLRSGGRSLPQHSWWEVLLVVAVGGALAAAGWRVRDEVRTRSRAKREADAARRAGSDENEVRAAAAAVVRDHDAVSSETARRVVVFAQAAAIGGGILAGWYAGQALGQLDRLSVPSVRSAIIVLATLVASAAALSVLGFVVQRWCTIPDDER